MQLDIGETCEDDPVRSKAKQLALDDLSAVFQFEAPAPLAADLKIRIGAGRALCDH